MLTEHFGEELEEFMPKDDDGNPVVPKKNRRIKPTSKSNHPGLFETVGK
jgi:hypothetical protein